MMLEFELTENGGAAGVAELAVQHEAANNLRKHPMVGKLLAMSEGQAVDAPHLQVVLAVKACISLVQVVHAGIIEGYASAACSCAVIRIVNGMRPGVDHAKGTADPTLRVNCDCIAPYMELKIGPPMVMPPEL